MFFFFWLVSVVEILALQEGVHLCKVLHIIVCLATVSLTSQLQSLSVPASITQDIKIYSPQKLM